MASKPFSLGLRNNTVASVFEVINIVTYIHRQLSYYARPDGVIFETVHLGFSDFESSIDYFKTCKLELTEKEFGVELANTCFLTSEEVKRVVHDLELTLDSLINAGSVDQVISATLQILSHFNTHAYVDGVNAEPFRTSFQYDDSFCKTSLGAREY